MYSEPVSLFFFFINSSLFIQFSVEEKPENNLFVLLVIHKCTHFVARLLVFMLFGAFFFFCLSVLFLFFESGFLCVVSLFFKIYLLLYISTL